MKKIAVQRRRVKIKKGGEKIGNEILWKVFAWISVICGVVAYLIGWIALFTKSVFWNIPNEFWFYDAVAAGVFGIFFLMYSMHCERHKRM